MRFLAALLWLCAALPATALEGRDARGLDVRVERMVEPVEVDGMALLVQRATGPDVAALARRVGERWRAAGSPVRELAQGGWRMASRWDAGHAELIQWRGTGDAAELLYSRMDARRQPAPPAAVPPQLPRRCTWGRRISGIAAGMRYQQRTARCRGAPATVMSELRVGLPAGGWQLREVSPRALQVARGAERALVTLVPGRSEAECWLAWISDLPLHGARR